MYWPFMVLFAASLLATPYVVHEQGPEGGRGRCPP